jgi:hypothetical protein
MATIRPVNFDTATTLPQGLIARLLAVSFATKEVSQAKA